jgi:5-formyltetrahydrofolate cyclo-ligase
MFSAQNRRGQPPAAASRPQRAGRVRPDFPGQPLYRQVYRRIEAMAMELPLDADGLLPPENQLMARFGVSRGTVRRATDELVRQGLLRVEPGRGTFVDQAAKVRGMVWDRLAAVARPDARFDTDLSRFVPDFDGRERCDQAIARLGAFADARTVFIAPDNSLEVLRAAAIADGKRVLVPTFGLRRGMVLVDGSGVAPADRSLAATLDGLERFGRHLDLAGLERLGQVDVLLTGAVAVTRRGLHFGGGQGYLDLEWGLLRQLGLVSAATPVIASVHGCQIIDADLAPAPHDAVVDAVVTPDETLRCVPALPKPAGLLWERIPADLDGPASYFHQLWLRSGTGTAS